MGATFSEQGKRKIMEGMVAMADSPFFMDGDEMRARYDDLRIRKADDGRLTVELAYRGKSVLTMAFDMPVGDKVLSLLADGSMAVSIQTQ